MGAYVRFCSSQYTAAGLLQKLVEIKPGFDEFLRQCQSGPKIKGMPLSFFLLKVGKSQKQLFLSSKKRMKRVTQKVAEMELYISDAHSLFA